MRTPSHPWRGSLAQAALGHTGDCRDGLRWVWAWVSPRLLPLSFKCSLSARPGPCKWFCQGGGGGGGDLVRIVSPRDAVEEGLPFLAPVSRPCGAQWPAPPLALLPGSLPWHDLAWHVPHAESPALLGWLGRELQGWHLLAPREQASHKPRGPLINWPEPCPLQPGLGWGFSLGFSIVGLRAAPCVCCS